MTIMYDVITGTPVVLPVSNSPWTDYTSTAVVSGSGSKVFTVFLAKFRQRMNGYEISFSINGNSTASGGGTANLTLSMPPGALIDAVALASGTLGTDANDEGFGFEYGVTSLNAYAPLGGIIPMSTTTIAFLRGGGAFITGAQMNNTNGVQITGKVWVPIVGLSASRAYGQGQATPSSPLGLYQAGAAPGSLLGTAIPAYAIGEMSGTTAGVQSAAVSASTTFNLQQITLTKGEWNIYAEILPSNASAAVGSFAQACASNVNATTMDTTVTNNDKFCRMLGSNAANSTFSSGKIATKVTVTAASEIWYLNGLIALSSGTAVLISSFYAIRNS